MDFSTTKYRKLLSSFQNQNYVFRTVEDFIKQPSGKVIITRHDVDRLPGKSLEIAEIQNSMGISGSFYFRIGIIRSNSEIIEKIATLGHEIGYHYEDVTLAQKLLKNKGMHKYAGNEKRYTELLGQAIRLFEKHLEQIRRIYPVTTICVHGSPGSRWDSRILWSRYKYKDYGIIGEPYFDIDFSSVLYLTDTGRRWNGDKFNIRDNIRFSGREPIDSLAENYDMKSTDDIIRANNNNRLPEKIMITFHPQRWTDKPLPWIKELVWQNMKNIIKYFVMQLRKER